MKKILFVLLFAVAPSFTFADAASTATITIRDGDVTAFTGVVEIAASTTPAVDITPTNSATAVAVPADSLLATLVALDATTADFDITDLAYFSSFNSFIINCITVPAVSTPHCFNWTYAVNGAFPQIGIDDTLLHDGDVVYLFFGPSRQTVLSTTTVAAGEPFTATAQTYDLASGTYVGAPGLTLGVGTPNPDFSFTELSTATSNANGEAIFTLNATGTFAVGIQEDFYFPSASITVTDAPATTTEEVAPPVDNPPPTGGGGGIVHTQLNVQNALAYLVGKQHIDGSYDSTLLTDWAALAFAASDPGAPKTLLREYLLTASPVLSSVTDYERHAMALMALGINPYSGTSVDYIAHITGAFDGTQIGDVHLDNDDIFALFPLLHAGYSAIDEIIQKTVAFILSAQNASGAWDGSVDMTAAAVQALAQVSTLPNVSGALAKAENYLRSQQKSNGGWDNSFSTSWTLQAIAALNQSPSSWGPSIFNPNDYLASIQQGDGGVEPTSSDTQTRTWATEYAIPASLGRTWASLLQSFPKPTNTTSGSGGAVLGVSTSTVATTTPAVATSTPLVATSTALTATSTPETVARSSTVAQEIKPAPKSVVKKAPVPIAKKAPEVTPPAPATSTPAQTALAAQAAPTPSGGFFTKLWKSVTSFFVWMF